MERYYYTKSNNIHQHVTKGRSRRRVSKIERIKQKLKDNKLKVLAAIYVILIFSIITCVTITSKFDTEAVEEIAVTDIDEINNDVAKEALADQEVNSDVELVEEQHKEFVEIVRDESESIFIEKKYIDSIQNNAFTFANVNVRTSPSLDSEVLMVLDKNTYVTRLGDREDGWSEVILNDHIYYINTYYLGTDDEYNTFLEAEAAKDTTPYSDDLVNEWGFSYDLQKYLWSAVCSYTEDRAKREHYYCYLLAVMQHESSLGNDKSNYNDNGTRDLGIMQVNSSNWSTLKDVGIITTYSKSNLTCDELQYNDYTGINAGMYYLNDYVGEYGISEKAYFKYNTGRSSGESNKNSRKVWKYYQTWLHEIYGV